MDDSKTCACGRTFTEVQSSGSVCFPCKLNTVGFNWRGPAGYGRKAFADTTMREVIADGDRNIVANGGDPKKDFEFVGNRWV